MTRIFDVGTVGVNNQESEKDTDKVVSRPKTNVPNVEKVRKWKSDEYRNYTK